MTDAGQQYIMSRKRSHPVPAFYHVPRNNIISYSTERVGMYLPELDERISDYTTYIIKHSVFIQMR